MRTWYKVGSGTSGGNGRVIGALFGEGSGFSGSGGRGVRGRKDK